MSVAWAHSDGRVRQVRTNYSHEATTVRSRPRSLLGGEDPAEATGERAHLRIVEMAAEVLLDAGEVDRCGGSQARSARGRDHGVRRAPVVRVLLPGHEAGSLELGHDAA